MTFRNTSETWGGNETGLTIGDYEEQAAIFAAQDGTTPATITADDDHIYADGVAVADRDGMTLVDILGSLAFFAILAAIVFAGLVM